MPLIPLSLQPIQTIAPEWCERTLIFRNASGRVHAVDAWCYGTLAVHAALPDEKSSLVVVTHTPSKIAIMRLDDPEEAIAAAEHLWATCRAAFVAIDKTVDASKIPPAMVLLVKNSNSTRRFVK